MSDNRYSTTRAVLSLEVTRKCNSSCVHCFARSGIATEHELDLAIAEQIAKEGLSLGYSALHITGGEPLMWGHLFPFLDRVFSSGYETVFLNTNGTLIDTGIARRLAEYIPGLSLSISLNGPGPLHDRIRGAGSHAKALEGTRLCRKAEIKVTFFTCTGRGLVADLAQYCSSLLVQFPGTDMALIQLIRSAGAFNLEEDLLRPKDFIAMVKTVSLLNLAGLNISILENPLARAAALALGLEWFPETLPLHRPGRVTVLADRSLTLAHSTRSRHGTYRPGMLRTILDSDEYRAATGPDIETCPQCPHYSLCTAGGMTRPSEWYRDMEEETPYCQRVMKLATGIKGKPL